MFQLNILNFFLFFFKSQVLITENGWVDDGEMEDDGRIEYIHDHLHEIQNAILNDGCNVKGYIAWSLIDAFEWAQGYK